jgi:hypothetical protein
MAGIIYGRGSFPNQLTQGYVRLKRQLKQTVSSSPFREILSEPQTAVAADASFDFTSSPSLPNQFKVSRASTATAWSSSGVLTVYQPDVPRIAYTWDGSAWTSAGLLVEDSRTNNVPTTLTSGSHWNDPLGPNGITIGYATPVAGPDGTNSAFTLTPSTNSNAHMVYWDLVALTTASPVALSCYVKPNGYSQVALRECATSGTGATFTLSGSGTVDGYFNQTGGTWSTSGATIEKEGNTGWWRISIVITPSSSIALSMGLLPINGTWTSANGDPYGGGTGSPSFAGDGTSGIIMYGPQLEQNTEASSLIVTGTNTTGTRAASVISTAEPSLMPNKAWVVETSADAPSVSVLGINTVTALGFDSSDHLTTADGGTQTTTATRSATKNRSGIAWDSTPRVSISLNGSTATTAANTPLTPTAIYFGSTNAGTSVLNGYIRKIDTYAAGLSDAALAAATSTANIVSGTGAAAGDNVTSGVAGPIQAKVGAAAGDNTTLGVAAPIQAKVGSATGANTATGVGQWIQAGAGSSAGSNTATGVGAWIQAGVGSSAGANTTTGVAGPIQAKVGSSAGANTVTGVGQWNQAGAGSSAGSNTATAVGAWIQAGVGSAAGSNTVSGVGAKLQDGVGNAAGSNITSGAAPGATYAGSAAGSNTTTGVGAWLQSGVGSSAGSNITSGAAPGAIVNATGSSVGDNIATAVGAWLQAGAGTSIGGNVATGMGPASDFNNDFDQSFGGYPGTQTGFGPGDFNNDFNNDFAVFSAGRIASGVGESAGGNIAAAVGSWSVFIPPVYPPPPPIPVQVWHPAQEYHRVQPSKATRVYRRETELRRRSPQGMKRRYG